MEWMDTIPVWLLGFVVFFFRVLDVSLGTVRTIALISGMKKVAMILGFFEVTFWVLAVAQVINKLAESPWLTLMYAAGFAAGNAIGMTIDQHVAFGQSVVRIISTENGPDIAEELRDFGQVVSEFTGRGRDGPISMLVIVAPRRKIKRLLTIARDIDPDVYYIVDRANDWRRMQRMLPHATGWQAILKKK